MSARGYIISIPFPASDPGVKHDALEAAVRMAGDYLVQHWTHLASGIQVDRATGAYIQGLQQRNSVVWPLGDDRLAVGVYNRAPHAGIVEWGHGAFNLASRINWGGPKVRQGKRGPYLIIPFRHMTPGRKGGGATPARFRSSMPASIYAIAKQLEPRERLTFRHKRQGTIDNGPVMRRAFGKDREVGRRFVGPGRPARLLAHGSFAGQYIGVTDARARREAFAHRTVVDIGAGRHVARHPGQAKSAASIAAGNDHARARGEAPPSPHRKERSIYEGMVKTGAPGHHQYMTFRVITPHSHWMIPAQAGRFVARRTATEAGPHIRAMMERAYAADVRRAMIDAMGGG